MLMPEAAADFNDFLSSWKRQIRLSRELCRVKPIAVAHAVDETTHSQLGRHSLASDAPHVLAASRWRN
jgi:hypothetical protein